MAKVKTSETEGKVISPRSRTFFIPTNDGEKLKYKLKEMSGEKLIYWIYVQFECALTILNHFNPKRDTLQDDIKALMIADNIMVYHALNYAEGPGASGEFVRDLAQSQKRIIISLQNELNQVEAFKNQIKMDNLIHSQVIPDFVPPTTNYPPERCMELLDKMQEMHKKVFEVTTEDRLGFTKETIESLKKTVADLKINTDSEI